MAKFVCTVCGYIYEGEQAPAECPICHAGADKFKKVEGELTLAAEHEFGVYAETVKNWLWRAASPPWTSLLPWSSSRLMPPS